MTGFQSQYMNPFGFMQPYQQPQFQNPVQVVKVNGENGAKAYQIGANSSALLLDESGLLVWLVTSDGAGYKTVTAYDIKPHQTAPAPDYGSLESRITRIEEIINVNARNTSTVSNVKSNDAISKENDRYGQYCPEPTGNDEPTVHKQSTVQTGYGDDTKLWGRS